MQDPFKYVPISKEFGVPKKHMSGLCRGNFARNKSNWLAIPTCPYVTRLM